MGQGLQRRLPLAAALLALACSGCAARAAAIPAHTGPTCKGPLTGRALKLPAGTKSFGKAQGQPPLPLNAGEYVVTIDDGPNPATTPELLDILAKNCVSATFMLIGQHAQAHPDLVKAIVARGNGVGSHSFDHGNFSKKTPEQIQDDIVQGVDAVDTALTGHARAPGEPRLFRIPGAAGVPQVPPPDWMAMLDRDHLILAGLDASPEDWRNDPAPVSFKRLLPRLSDRGVILFHDGQPHTLELLPMVLDELKRRGDTVVTLSLARGERP